MTTRLWATTVALSAALALVLGAAEAAPGEAATKDAAQMGHTNSELTLTASQLAMLKTEQGTNGASMGNVGVPGSTRGVRGPQALGAAATWKAPGTQGLDVSNWNQGINWSSVAGQGAQFAYVKSTEGLTYKSPSWASQYTGSAKAGLIRGSYHFALPPSSSGAAQARYFVANGGGWSADGITLPPLLDIEFNPYASMGNTCYNMTPAQLTSWISDFVTTTRQLIGRNPAIYTSTSWWNQCVKSSGFGAYPLHVARYSQTAPTLPAGWSKYTIWQYSSTGPFPGDSDAFNGSAAQLKSWANNNTSPPVPSQVAATTLSGSFGAGQTMTSPNGKFTMYMQGDGNLVTYNAQKKPVWGANTMIPGMWAAAQSDGNLVIYDKANRARWYTGTSGSGRKIQLQDDGNLVIRDSKGNVLWDAFGASKRAATRVETTITQLRAGQSERSLSGNIQLIMQGDGNLVLYSAAMKPTWASNTSGHPGAWFAVQADGNLVVYSSSNKPLWASNSYGHSGAKLYLQPDGNLVLYGTKAVWAAH